MKIIDCILCTSIMLICSISSYTQGSESDEFYRDGTRYFYMGDSYSYKELGPLFHDDQSFITPYMKSFKRKKAATIWGIATIGVAVWGGVIASDCEELGCLLVLVPIGLGSITGTISLILLASSYNFKAKSIDALKFSFGQRSSLSFGAGTNGLGIFYRF